MNNEPVAVGAAISGVLTAGLALAVGLGWWTLDPEEVGIVLTFLFAVQVLVAAVTRNAAFGPDTVERDYVKRTDLEPAKYVPASPPASPPPA